MLGISLEDMTYISMVLFCLMAVYFLFKGLIQNIKSKSKFIRKGKTRD